MYITRIYISFSYFFLHLTTIKSNVLCSTSSRAVKQISVRHMNSSVTLLQGHRLFIIYSVTIDYLKVIM